MFYLGPVKCKVNYFIIYNTKDYILTLSVDTGLGTVTCCQGSKAEIETLVIFWGQFIMVL